MHRKEGLMFKNMGQTYADMKKLHEEAAGMPLDDMFMDHIVKPFATRDALSHSLHRLNEDYESLKAQLAESEENHNVTIEANSRLQHQVDCAIAKIRRLEIAAGMVKEARQQLAEAQAENAELRGINQSLSVDWVKFNDMKSALEFFSRLKQDMLIIDITRIASKALGI